MRYHNNLDNIVRKATSLTCTNIVPSQHVFRSAMSRKGGGAVKLTGGYTGQADAVFDVEVQNNTITGAPQVSTPTFAGRGNGTMTAVTANAGVAAQRFQVTCIDLGTETRKAYTPFQGATLRAKTAGSGGNSITISVNEGSIARASTNFSLLSDLQEGTNEYTGLEWDFGAAVLTPEGTIPSSAPRISFGDDPQVYRQYKEFRDGRYVYSFSPAPVRSVGKGAKVKAVTGSRTVVVTNGTTTNTYNTITTLYSLLSAIQGDASALLEVVEPVTVDERPSGMAVTEMSVRTTSFLASLEREGTLYAEDAEIGFVCSGTAPTEQIKIRCKNADTVGEEQWAVEGTVSGTLTDAITGVLYDGANYDFTIPVALPPAQTPGGSLAATLKLVAREASAAKPGFCFEDLVAGSEARTKTYRFIWKQRPGEACECDISDLVGGPSDAILGIEVTGTGGNMSEIPTALQSRAEDLWDWYTTFVDANTSILAGNTTGLDDASLTSVTAGEVTDRVETNASPGSGQTIQAQKISAILKVDRVDIQAAAKAKDILYSALKQVHDAQSPVSLPSPSAAEWDAAFTDLQNQFANINSLTASDYWRTAAVKLKDTGTDDPATIAKFANTLLSRDYDIYLERFRARMAYVLVLGGVEPDFDSATLKGNAVWQDHGGKFWFESQDGLLPLQPGFYYHSAVLDENGDPISTREFGIGVVIGCPELLIEGDELEIQVEVAGNLRSTYQVGDTFNITIIRAAAVALGGGQTGNDTLTWRVLGDTAGALSNYALNKLTPNTYSNGGVSFLISPGGVPFALGDIFTFYTEGGQFRWRKNGGSWSSNDIGASVSMIDGLSAAFTPGAAPSFVPGDIYTFTAEAVNGPANLRSPIGGKLRTTGGNATIDMHENSGGVTTQTADCVFLGDVVFGGTANPGSETITLVASNNADYSSPIATFTLLQQASPTSSNYGPVKRRCYAVRFSSTSAKYWRLQTSSGADVEIGFAFVGKATELMMAGGLTEKGTATLVHRLSRPGISASIGVQIEHELVSDDSIESLLSALGYAAQNDGGMVAVAFDAADKHAEAALVEVETEVDVEDLHGFQNAESSERFNRIRLTLQPAA